MRLAIIEDNLPLLDNLKLLLGGENGITVVGAFGSAEDALKGLEAVSPELLLVDLGLPDMSGLEFIKRVKAAMPELDIMVYTVFDDWPNVFAAIKAGATGYILKGTSPRELIEAIRNLHQGGAPMSRRIARMVVSEFHGENKSEQTSLSVREREILNDMNKSFTYKEIAANLNISPHTVRTHIKNIYKKLQTKSKQDAISKGIKQGSV
jgi:two-component system NarL family response regulator